MPEALELGQRIWQRPKLVVSQVELAELRQACNRIRQGLKLIAGGSKFDERVQLTEPGWKRLETVVADVQVSELHEAGKRVRERRQAIVMEVQEVSQRGEPANCIRYLRELIVSRSSTRSLVSSPTRGEISVSELSARINASTSVCSQVCSGTAVRLCFQRLSVTRECKVASVPRRILTGSPL